MTADEIQVTIPVKTLEVVGLLTSGFEGGMFRQWGRVRGKGLGAKSPGRNLWTDPEMGRIRWPWYSTWPVSPGGCIVVEDTEEKFKPYHLAFEHLRFGLALMARDHPQHFAQFMEGNADEVTGDVFIQLCTIGKLTYG